MSGKRGMNKSKKMGGVRKGAGRKPASIGTFVMDCMPMMADVVSGSTHRPREQRRNESPLAWAKQTHAWPRVVAVVGTRRAANPELICKRADIPAGHYENRVAWVRQVLGYDDALVLRFGHILVAIQSDGVRAAITDVENENAR